jgi:hypothetical protein
MLNDSSLPIDANNFVFDLDSQKGTAHLLASIRAGALSSEQKNELRDLVLLYANGGKDQSVRLTLEQKVSSYQVQPLPQVPEVASVPTPIFPFGSSRPIPTKFSVDKKVISDSVPVKPVAPAPNLGQSGAISQRESGTIPVKPVQTINPTVTPSLVSQVSSNQAPQISGVNNYEQKPEPAIATNNVVSEPTPTVNIAPETINEPPPHDAETNLRRIKEIKAIVNAKVGNPVNLIDINNEVGREYMGALLDAMKKINSGASAHSAMKRLETAYQTVERTLAENNVRENSLPISDAVTTADPIPSPVSQPSISPIISSVQQPPVITEYPEPISVLPIETESIEPNQQAKTSEPEPIISRQSYPSPEPVVTDIPVTVVQNNNPLPTAPTADDFVPIGALGQTPVSPVTFQPRPVVAESELPLSTTAPQTRKPAVDMARIIEESRLDNAIPITHPEVNTVSAPVRPPIINSGQDNLIDVQSSDQISSLRSNVVPLSQSREKLLTPADLPTASAIETSTIEGDPLYTKEVSDGLHQLLSEWQIFKKSGLFGTGPKGSEHPLFLRIANTQIPLILAGRFEGATQEVKQSITDYMNGWRYEQGIIYEQGETFEHYLRRIIRHILDLQKQRGAS